MKKNILLWGILALVFAVTIVGCKDETEAPPVFPAAKGKLTINGLSSFNDKYVYVQGLAGSSVLVGLTDITGYPSDIGYKLVKISGGKAEVPLYTANSSASSYSNSYIAYSGNDTLTSANSISIIILNDSSLKASNAATAITNNLGRKMITSGTFSNGNITVEWGTIAGTWTPSGVSPAQLTENQWTNGTISTSSGIQWYTFIATADTQYIHIAFGTLTSVSIQVFDSNGDTVGNQTTNLDSSTRYTSRSARSAQKYFIKVWPYSSSGSGNYQITFNKSSSTPSGSTVTWTPPGSNPTQLTENQWANGTISTSSGEQWFTFTATAYTQYIHVTFGTLTDLYVQLYDSNGNTIGSNTNLYGSGRYISRSVTTGQKYYIKVWPASGSGTYQITFNASSSTPSGSTVTWTPPGSSPTQLTENQWANGTISTSSGEQWFMFTATAYTQYIHVTFGTLTDLYVQVYDSNGNTVGSNTNLYGSTRSISKSVTTGQKYYIKVWPFSGSGSYQIAFNTSSSTPGSSSGIFGGGSTHTHIYGSWTYLATTAEGTVIYTRSCTICGLIDTRYE